MKENESGFSSSEEGVQAEKCRVPNGKVFLVVACVLIAAAILGMVLLSSESENSEPAEKFDESERVVFNGFEFQNLSGIWRTAWVRSGQPYNIDFRYHPRQVMDVPIEGSIDGRFQSKKTYVTFDPPPERSENNSYLVVASFELSQKLLGVFDRNLSAACTVNETEGCASLPIVTCDSTDEAVVYLKVDDESKVVQDGNCVTVQGSGKDLVRAADRALYEWLRII